MNTETPHDPLIEIGDRWREAYHRYSVAVTEAGKIDAKASNSKKNRVLFAEADGRSSAHFAEMKTAEEEAERHCPVTVKGALAIADMLSQRLMEHEEFDLVMRLRDGLKTMVVQPPVTVIQNAIDPHPFWFIDELEESMRVATERHRTGKEGEDDWAKAEEIERRILTTPARTLSGVITQLRVRKHHDPQYFKDSNFGEILETLETVAGLDMDGAS